MTGPNTNTDLYDIYELKQKKMVKVRWSEKNFINVTGENGAPTTQWKSNKSFQRQNVLLYIIIYHDSGMYNCHSSRLTLGNDYIQPRSYRAVLYMFWPCVNTRNCIWCLKQHILEVKGYVWFHLHRFSRAVREVAKNNWKLTICLQ